MINGHLNLHPNFHHVDGRDLVYGRLEGYSRDVWMVWNAESNTARELSKWIAD